MFEGKRVGVVVPAYDEEALIGTTIAGIPPLADRIIVVDAGRVVETGHHDDLVARRGPYARMWAAAEGETLDDSIDEAEAAAS